MEKEIVDALNSQDLSPADTKALLTEALRAELARILAEQSSMGSLTDEDADKRIEELEAENNSQECHSLPSSSTPAGASLQSG
ncbi:hypothetical protein [Phaeobacter inhibens]|uniref:hypothetical protein n=1 Tax=Phaeobacter inhibens TaxID=221822 RepID=UPI001C2F70F0|nr:hypothetical protein [Phaeobacter inhibens]